MDILLIDPPLAILKDGSTDRGYNVGLTSLAAYLRNGGIDAAVVTSDIILGTPSRNVLSDPLSLFVPDWLRVNVRELAERQRVLEKKVNDKGHIIWKKLSEIISRNNPKAVGISYLTSMKSIVERIALLVKEVNPEIKVIVGSFHPTFRPEEVMQNRDIDFVVRGEGEIPLLSLVKELSTNSPKWEQVPGIHYRGSDDKVQSTVVPRPIEDLDRLPFIARDLVLGCDYDVYRDHAIITARGCFYTCSFCADRAFWGGNVRRRSVENVMQEIKFLKDTYKKISAIDFVDGTFTYDRKYLRNFCQTVINQELDINWRCTARYDNLDEEILRLMKRSGCSALYLGLESGSDRILKDSGKRITVEKITRVSQLIYDSGIYSITSVLLGLPYESREDIEKTLEMMKDFKTDFFDVNTFIPLAGTQLWEAMSEDDIQNIDWLRVGYKSWENTFAKEIPHQEFNNYQARAYEIANELRKRSLVRLGTRLLTYAILRLFKKLLRRLSR